MGCTYILHIRTDNISDKDMRIWNGNSVGHPLFRGFFGTETTEMRTKRRERWNELYSIIGQTPSFEFGEHSFLKGAISGDDSYVSSYTQLEDIIKDVTGYGELITDEIIEQVEKWAYDFIGDTSYYMNQADTKELITFLKKHKDKKAFFTCW